MGGELGCVNNPLKFSLHPLGQPNNKRPYNLETDSYNCAV